MKRNCCVLVLFFLASLCIAQEETLNTPFPELSPFAGPDYLFRLGDSPDSSEDDQETQSQPLFNNSPLWVKDLRRGEIVFFGTLPFTVFFTRTFVDIFRMGMNGWDRRYAPWPLQSAGGVMMNKNELILTYSIAVSVSLVISIVDHFIIRNKRKAAAVLEE